MAYLYTPQLKYPLDDYEVNALGFKVRGIFKGIDYGVHLGEDILRSAGTVVKSIGRGKVVYSALHKGYETRGNWGNIIVIAYKNPNNKKVFYGIYGHLGDRLKKVGNRVECGEIIGSIGDDYTIENGWWAAHLHFGIYSGIWKGVVLPGYYKKERKRTRLSDWKNPSDFIDKYDGVISKFRKYFVYIVRCVDGTLYTGITTNVIRRIEEHNNSKKGAKYTRNKRPVELVYMAEFSNRSRATKRELEVKKLKREEKITLISKFNKNSL